MNKLYLILALIIFLIIIIIYKHYTIEYFKNDDKTPEELAKIEKENKERTARIEQYKKDKDEKSALNYLSINTLMMVLDLMFRL
jgi:cell division protein FtsI/penicillin-binding protein 2